jgi:hypothetical protein
MVRSIRWIVGGVFSLALATLIPFLVEKGAAPKGHTVLWGLYAALAISAVVWLLATWFARHSSPKTEPLSIIYTLDGSPNLCVQLRPGRPQIALLEVALKNSNSFNLEGIAVNSLIPHGLRVFRCGMDGKEREAGSWLTTSEKLPDEPSPGMPKDYWADENMTVAGNGTKLLLFKLRITRPGTYFLKTLVFGSVEKQQEEAMLKVTETERMTIGAIIAELIHDGERLTDGRQAAQGMTFARWREEGAFLVGFIPREDQRWWADKTADPPLGFTDAERDRHLVASRVPALYELRRRLDRPPSEP